MPRAPGPRGRSHVRRACRARAARLIATSHHPADLPAALRAVLLDPDEALDLDVHGAKDAAVLLPVYVAGDDLHVVFTKRRDDLRRHAGEISFPGGRPEAVDTDLRATALREAQEEIGLDPEHVELLGALIPTPTIATNYAVYPYVGFIEPGYAWVPSDGEVDQILEFTVPVLRASFGRRRLVRRGVPFRTDTYEIDEHLIWGATARILGDFLERLPPELG